MRKAKILNYKLTQFVYSKIIEKSAGYIVLSAVFSTIITIVFTQHENALIYLAIILSVLLVAYFLLSCESKYLNHNAIVDLIKSKLSKGQGIFCFSNNQIFVQNCNLPFCFGPVELNKYEIDLKIRVLNNCFGIFLSYDPDNKTGYMLQYDVEQQKFRPHFLHQYIEAESKTIWSIPDDGDSLLKSSSVIPLLKMNDKFHLRIIVEYVDYTNADFMRSLGIDDVNLKMADPKMQFDRNNFKKSMIVRVLDMNEYAIEKWAAFYLEPPFKIYEGKYLGFRQWGAEAAIFEDVSIYK